MATTLITAAQRRATLERLDKSWRAILTPPRGIKPDVWAEANIIVTEGDAPGSLHLDRTPYLRDIVNTLTDPKVKTVTLCFASQSGKTMAIFIVILFTISELPGSPILFAVSTGTLRDDISQDRLGPMIDACPATASLKLTGRHDQTKTKKRFQTCTLKFATGGSTREAKSRPVKILCLDEIEGFRQANDKESGTLVQFTDRVKSFLGSKIYQSSTPELETGAVWKEFLKGSQEYFHVPCPHCGEYQKLWTDEQNHNLTWDKERPEARLPDGKWNVEHAKATAFYRCPSCGGKIEDKHKAHMLRDGRWVADNPSSTSHRSFHLNSLYPVWLTFGRTLEKFLQTYSHADAHKEFKTQWMAEPWSKSHKVLAQHRLMKKCGEYAPGHVPEGVNPVAVIMTVDVQADCCWYVVRAWCAKSTTSYLMDCGQATRDGIVEVVKRQYQFPISHVFVDTGHTFGGSLVPWCVQHNFVCIKGSGVVHQLHHLGATEHGVPQYHFNVLKTKDILAERIESKLGLDGSWYLFKPDDAHSLREYFIHMTSERREEILKHGFSKPIWKKLEGVPNHLFDCESYQIGAMSVLGCEWQQPVELDPAPKPTVNNTKPEPQPGLRMDDGRGFWELPQNTW